MTLKVQSLIISSIIGLLVLLSIGFVSNSMNQVEDIWQDYNKQSVTKLALLSDIKAQFGYGGFIHNFKNYILRGQEKYINRFKDNSQKMNLALSKLSEITGTAEEQNALEQIKIVAQAYTDNMKIAANLVSQGKTPAEIDKVVKIDDAPAFAGFATISKAIENEEKITSLAMMKNLSGLKIITTLTMAILVTAILIFLGLVRSVIIRLAQVTSFATILEEGNFGSSGFSVLLWYSR